MRGSALPRPLLLALLLLLSALLAVADIDIDSGPDTGFDTFVDLTKHVRPVDECTDRECCIPKTDILLDDSDGCWRRGLLLYDCEYTQTTEWGGAYASADTFRDSIQKVASMDSVDSQELFNRLAASEHHFEIPFVAIPELQLYPEKSRDWVTFINTTELDLLRTYVTRGGTLIVLGDEDKNSAHLLNELFGWSLEGLNQNDNPDQISQYSPEIQEVSFNATFVPHSNWSCFNESDRVLTYKNDFLIDPVEVVFPVSKDSMPPAGIPVYSDQVHGLVWVWYARVGYGQVIFLALDWFGPDAAWDATLHEALAMTARPFLNHCPDHSACNNSGFKRDCVCDEGWEEWIPNNTGPDVEFECVDVNECREASACPENADCENTEGSFYCECHEGYRMTDQGCEDINECEYECNYPPGIGLVVKLCDWRDSSFLLFHELRLVVPVDLVSPEELFSHLMENPDGVSFVFLPTTGYDLEPAFNSSLRAAVASYVRGGGKLLLAPPYPYPTYGPDSYLNLLNETFGWTTTVEFVDRSSDAYFVGPTPSCFNESEMIPWWCGDNQTCTDPTWCSDDGQWCPDFSQYFFYKPPGDATTIYQGGMENRSFVWVKNEGNGTVVSLSFADWWVTRQFLGWFDDVFRRILRAALKENRPPVECPGSSGETTEVPRDPTDPRTENATRNATGNATGNWTCNNTRGSYVCEPPPEEENPYRTYEPPDEEDTITTTPVGNETNTTNTTSNTTNTTNATEGNTSVITPETAAETSTTSTTPADTTTTSTTPADTTTTSTTPPVITGPPDPTTAVPPPDPKSSTTTAADTTTTSTTPADTTTTTTTPADTTTSTTAAATTTFPTTFEETTPEDENTTNTTTPEETNTTTPPDTTTPVPVLGICLPGYVWYAGIPGTPAFIPGGGICVDQDECLLDRNMCPHNAYCINTIGSFVCVCPPGMYGNPPLTLCSKTSWVVRTVLRIVGFPAAFEADFDSCIKLIYTSFLLYGNATVTPESLDLSETAKYDLLGVVPIATAPMHKVALFAFFISKEAALAAEATLLANQAAFLAALTGNCSSVLPGSFITNDPVYAVNSETTEDPLLFPATGLRVDAVSHDRLCMSQGCWVIDFTFTLGTNDTMNALYIPRIFNNNTLTSYAYPQAVQDTFGVENFPCGNEGYDPNNPTQRTTACCLPTFEEAYRPIASFGDFLGTLTTNVRHGAPQRVQRVPSE